MSNPVFLFAVFFISFMPVNVMGGFTVEKPEALKSTSLVRWSEAILDEIVTYRSLISETDAEIVSAPPIDKFRAVDSTEQSPTDDSSSDGGRYSTAATIEALTPSHLDHVYLTFPGREGKFVFSNTDLSAEVTEDTVQGIYIAPDRDDTGASGAWVRQYDDGVKVEWFGAVGNNVNDDQPAITVAAAVLNAKGGGTIRGEAGKTYRLANQINIHDMANLVFEGAGATLFKYTAGSAASSFNIQNSKNITIRGWKIDSNYNGFASGSTGSNSNIFLQTSSGQANDRIVIEKNIFNNGNHSHVTIGQAGIDAVLAQGEFAHQNIWIQRNKGSNAGTFTFIYKATRNVWVSDNVGKNYSMAAFALDTSAAGSDSDTNHYTIENVWLERNQINNIVTVNRFAGRGIFLKGGVYNVNVGHNIIDHIESVTNVETYGIIVTQDQHVVTPKTGADIDIYNNSIKNVFSSASGATAGWVGSVAKGYDNVRITDNSFDTAERGFRASNSSEIEFRGNRFVGLSTARESPLQFIYEGTASAKKKTVRDNIFINAAGVMDAAISVPAYCSDIRFGTNKFDGFTKNIHIAVGANYKGAKNGS